MIVYWYDDVICYSVLFIRTTVWTQRIHFFINEK